MVSHADDSYFSMDFQSGGPTAQNPPPGSFGGPDGNNFNSNPNTFYNNQFGANQQRPPSVPNQFNSFYQPQQPPPLSQPDKNNFGNVFANQQFLVSAGQQLLSNPMTAAAIDAYSQSLVDKSKGYIGNVWIF